MLQMTQKRRIHQFFRIGSHRPSPKCSQCYLIKFSCDYSRTNQYNNQFDQGELVQNYPSIREFSLISATKHHFCDRNKVSAQQFHIYLNLIIATISQLLISNLLYDHRNIDQQIRIILQQSKEYCIIFRNRDEQESKGETSDNRFK